MNPVMPDDLAIVDHQPRAVVRPEMERVLAGRRHLQQPVEDEPEVVAQLGHPEADQAVVHFVGGHLVFRRQCEEIRQAVPVPPVNHARQLPQPARRRRADLNFPVHDHGMTGKGADEIQHRVRRRRRERQGPGFPGIDHRRERQHPRVIRNPLPHRPLLPEFPRLLRHLHEDSLATQDDKIVRQLVLIAQRDLDRLARRHPQRAPVILHQPGQRAQLDHRRRLRPQHHRHHQSRHRDHGYNWNHRRADNPPFLRPQP